MKRKLLLLSVAMMSLVLTGGFVSCKNNNSNNSTQNSASNTINITATGNKTTLTVGGTVQLESSVNGVTWSLEKEGIISVSDTGLVTALAAGKNTVLAKKNGYGTGKITINVQAEKIEITAPEGKDSVVVKNTIQLSASKEGVTWTSSDTSIATVSATGLVSALKVGEVTITAAKDGMTSGIYNLNVVRPDATATLHFEDASHYSANGWWSSVSNGSERGPGATPIYNKDAASDGTCVAYFESGDKETISFNASAAAKAELVVTMGNYSAFEDLSLVEKATFNNKEISLAGVSYNPGDDPANYVFADVSFGEVDLVAGENKLVIEFIASAPYLDDLKIYATTATQIAVNKAPEMQNIQVTTESVTVEEGATQKIVCTTQGCSFVSGNEGIATVANDGTVTGVAKGTTSITVMKEGMKSVRVPVTVSEKTISGEIRVEAEVGEIEDGPIAFRTPSANTNASGKITSVWPSEATLTLEFDSTVAGKMNLIMVARAGTPENAYSYAAVDLAADVEIMVNGKKVTLTGSIESTVTKLTSYELGEVDVVAGKNTITVKAINVAPTIDFFKLTPVSK